MTELWKHGLNFSFLCRQSVLIGLLFRVLKKIHIISFCPFRLIFVSLVSMLGGPLNISYKHTYTHIYTHTQITLSHTRTHKQTQTNMHKDTHKSIIQTHSQVYLCKRCYIYICVCVPYFCEVDTTTTFLGKMRG